MGKDQRIEKLNRLVSVFESIEEVRSELYEVAKEIAGVSTEDRNNIVFDFLFNEDGTAEDLLKVLHDKHHWKNRQDILDNKMDGETVTDSDVSPANPLDWSGLYDDEHSPEDLKSFVAKSCFNTGTKARAEWIIDYVTDQRLFESVESEGPLFTICRSSAALLDSHAPGTSELFETVDEAKERCQEIEDRLCSEQGEPEVSE